MRRASGRSGESWVSDQDLPARFFELPARVGGAAGAADFRTYVVSVEHAGRIHTVTAIEPIGDPSLQALIETVRARQRRPV